MAKRKTYDCSTGHGTGITPPVELRTILDRMKTRLAIKRGLRPARYTKVKAEQVEARNSFLSSREYRGMLRSIGIRDEEAEAA